MFTTDAHCDLLSSCVVHHKPLANCTVTLERLIQGNVSIQTFAAFINFKRGTPYEDTRKMFAMYETLPLPHLDRRLPDALPEVPSSILSIEGCEAFAGSIEKLRALDDSVHFRLAALTWNYVNELGTPACKDDTTGLTPFGFEALKEMDARGICADVSHLNIAGFWDVIEHTAVPPVASHSNCRWLCDVSRNLNKDQVRALIERKGFIGMNFYSDFIRTDRKPDLNDLAEHIDEIMALGGEDIVGFGSDFDGISSSPDGLDTPADLPAFLDLLSRRGYTQAQLKKIAGENYFRVLKTAESMRVYPL